jgi:uncharacterized protein with HEPN domain
MRTVHQSLRDILDAIRWIATYTEGLSFTEFQKRHETQDAVIYRLGVIGEAAGNLMRLEPEIADKFPSVPWPEIIGFRNRIFHAYWSISEIVYRAVLSLDAKGSLSRPFG